MNLLTRLDIHGMIQSIPKGGGKRREEDTPKQADVYLYVWLRKAALFIVRLPGLSHIGPTEKIFGAPARRALFLFKEKNGDTAGIDCFF